MHIPIILLFFQLSSTSNITRQIPIENNGFELDVIQASGLRIPNNTYEYGGSIISRWTHYDPFNIAKLWTFGIANPSGGMSFTSPTETATYPPTEGTQSAYIELETKRTGEIGIVQILSAYVTSITTYKLYVRVGNPASNTWSDASKDLGGYSKVDGFPGYRIDLLAGNRTMASDDNTLYTNGDLPDGIWAKSVITVTPNVSSQYIGQQLAVRLLNLNGDGGVEVFFDDVVLEAIGPRILTNITAIFSDDYLSVFVYFVFDYNNIQVMIRDDAMHECGNIFVAKSNVLLGANANCMWKNESDYKLQIDLGSNSIINMNDELIISKNAFYYVFADIVYNLTENIVVNIAAANNPIPPHIIVDNLPSVISICDDLMLNAASTRDLGGREAIFEWQFVSSVPNSSNSYLIDDILSMYGDIVVIAANQIDSDSVLGIQLSVFTWFNTTETTEMFDIYKSDEVHITLSGPNTYSVTNNNYKHDYINFNAIISSNTDCMKANNISIMSVFNWSVSSTSLTDTALNQIATYLNTAHSDHVAIDTDLISPGNDYIFNVTATKTSSSASLSLYYEYSDIACSINSGGGDTMYLESITKQQFVHDYILYLDGYTMSYDPNAMTLDYKTHLKWDWQCVNVPFNLSCTELFDDNSQVYSKYITFNNITNVSDHYLFSMRVSDANNLNRAACTSQLHLIIDFIANQNINVKYLSLSISVTSNIINSEDRLRIILLLINDEIEGNNEYYNYEWVETNNFISKRKLNRLNINDAANGNLILEAGVLQKGYLYKFKVTVTKWSVNNDGTAVLIGNGVSQSIDSYVLKAPTMSQFLVYPPCNNQKYSSLLDLVNTKYYISVSGDSDYWPLFYQFLYYFDSDPAYEYSMHNSLLFEPFLFDIILPFGTFTLKSIIYDSKQSSVSQELPCDISIENVDRNECISFQNDIVNNFESVSNSKILNHIFQMTPIYLSYIGDYYSDEVCLETILSEMISVYTSDIFTNYNFCVNDWSLLYGQIFTEYLQILIAFDFVPFIFSENMNEIKSIISLILDPCNATLTIIHDINLLFLSPNSIIDKNVIIFYETPQNDITNQINQNILSDMKHSNILYELSSSLLTIIDILNGGGEHEDIMQLLSKSLYIHALFQLSLSIPGETVFSESYGFEIYSSRVDVDGDVNVSLHDIKILIDNDVFQNGRDSFCDLSITTECIYDSVDVIIIAQNNTNNNVIIQQTDKCNKDLVTDYNGSIANESISIVVIGGNLSDSAANASIIFDDESLSSYTDIQCVWFDEELHKWENTGCSTIINYELNTIECDCNHLTTFSIVHSINNLQENCDEILTKHVGWKVVHIIFLVLFIFVLIHTSRELLPFIRHNRFNPFREKSLLSMSSVFVIAFINILLCISFVSIDIYASNNDNNHANIVFLTFLLLSPQWFYFIIFGVVLYSWIIVSMSLTDCSNANILSILTKSLKTTTIALMVFGFLQFLIISFVNMPSNMLWIYSASQIFWASLLLFASIIFTMFGYKTQQIIRKTATMIKNMNSSNEDSSNPTDTLMNTEIKLSNKLLLATIVISSFFLIQCILIIYFLIIDNYKNILPFRIIDLLSHYICLLVICLLYKNTFNRLRAENGIKPLCVCRCIKNIQTITTDTTRDIAHSVSAAVSTTIKARTSSQLTHSEAFKAKSTSRPTIQLSAIQETVSDGKATLDRKEGDGQYPTLDRRRSSVSISSLDSDHINDNESYSPKKHAIDKTEGVLERKELLKLTTVKLARKCREMNISSKGSKADLVNRIIASNKALTKVTPKLKLIASDSTSFHN